MTKLWNCGIVFSLVHKREVQDKFWKVSVCVHESVCLCVGGWVWVGVGVGMCMHAKMQRTFQTIKKACQKKIGEYQESATGETWEIKITK